MFIKNLVLAVGISSHAWSKYLYSCNEMIIYGLISIWVDIGVVYSSDKIDLFNMIVFLLIR